MCVSIAFGRVVRIPRIQRRALREPLRGVCLKCVCYDPSFPQLTIPGILLTLAATFAQEKEAPFSWCVSSVSVHDRPPSSHGLIHLVTSQYTARTYRCGNGHREGEDYNHLSWAVWPIETIYRLSAACRSLTITTLSSPVS